MARGNPLEYDGGRLVRSHFPVRNLGTYSNAHFFKICFKAPNLGSDLQLRGNLFHGRAPLTCQPKLDIHTENKSDPL